jgi:hypothetical protein
MTEHIWETYEVDGEYLGDADCWRCLRCKASGGPCRPKQRRPPHAYLPLDGRGFKVISDDCDVALQQIEADRTQRERVNHETIRLVLELPSLTKTDRRMLRGLLHAPLDDNARIRALELIDRNEIDLDRILSRQGV